MFQNRELIQSKRTRDLPNGKSSEWQLYEKKKSLKNKAVWYSRRDGGQEISKLPLEKCSSCKENGHWKKLT